ncbi:MAG: helix-turn-helix domain-containing protein [Desulfobulbaceae bacterium]|nr:helix-turn-helix domain-containing protein [Desulfobulbaceae bacterium]
MNEENIPSGSQAVSRIDGTKIRSIRESKELTQLYVATVVGVTTDTISRWENRRYPTIKQENALKLAEVLEVDLADILDTETSATTPETEDTSTARTESSSTKNFPPLKIIIAFTGIAIALGIAFILKPAKVNEPIPATITAQRILPAHVAPGQPFPIIIKVDISPPGSYSMIVRETVPLDCLVIKGLPSFASLDKKNGILKWIGKATSKTSFSYLARTKPTVMTDKKMTFFGSATLKKDGRSSQIDINGDETVTLKKLHWADSNGDYRIDDEEILAIYDQLETMTELGTNDLQSDVEDIWAASGYSWDEKTGNFVIIP